MLDSGRLARALERHALAHRLFRWFVERPIADEPQQPAGSEEISEAEIRDRLPGRRRVPGDVAREFADPGLLGRMLVQVGDDLPKPLRFDRHDVTLRGEFATLMSTYLRSTYQMPEREDVLFLGHCDLSSWSVVARHLKMQKPRASDRLRARELQLDALVALAAERGRVPSRAELEPRLDDRAVDRDVARVAWALQLLERLEGRTEGAANLVLWRAFAWDDARRPIAGFELRVQDFLDAEARLAAVLA